MLASPREIAFPHRRIHSPSPSDMWMSPAKHTADLSSPSAINTVSFPPASRPTLGSLDLASPPHQSALPLTPPLTPASARPTESDGYSSRSNSIDVFAFDPYLRVQDYSPLSQWSASDHYTPIRNISDFDHFTVNPHRKLSSDSSILPSPISPTHPKGSSIVRVRELESDLETQPASRFLFVSGVPKNASSQTLKQAFVGCGDLKGIFVRFQAEHGAIILAFFDVRHSVRAHRQINTRMFFDNVRLASRFISADDLRQLIGQSNFVNSNDGDLFISTSFVGPEGELNAVALQNVLASFGDLRSFGVMDTHARAFHVEYLDARDATSALNALNGRTILGVRLRLAPRDPEGTTDEYSPRAFETASTLAPAPPPAQLGNTIPFPHKPSPPVLERRLSIDDSLHSQAGRVRHASLQHSHSEQDLRAKAKTQADETETGRPRTKTPPQHVHARRISNIYKFDAVGKMPLPPSTPPRPRSISVSSETSSPVAGRLALPPYTGPLPAPLAYADAEQTSPWPSQQEHSSYLGLADEAYTAEREPAHTPTLAQAHASYAPEQFFMGPVAQPHPPALQLHMPGRVRQFPMSGHGPRGGLGLELMTDAPAERNKIDIARIERGDDTRTTVMIKNIPNKMSDRHLIDFINEVCPRKIDFLYLRMDFTNGCNVGYAFVNFIHVEDLLHFARAKLGTKWNLFSSEKILGMSYANYQGKEALIDKFRSSSIMDQRESWRPKLFYSAGPKRGLPEDFPGPTHLRRKERSNFVPSELHQARALFHHPPGMRG